VVKIPISCSLKTKTFVIFECAAFGSKTVYHQETYIRTVREFLSKHWLVISVVLTHVIMIGWFLYLLIWHWWFVTQP
jgi:hypothetical protein